MSPLERALVRWSSWATGLTGLVYLWMKHFMTASEPWAVVNHPLQPWILKAHILVAPVLVFALGLVSVNHVWRHWRRRIPSGRRSGLLLMLVAGPMVVTGYLIQVVVHPAWLSVVAWAHIGFGAAFLGGFVAHAVPSFRNPRGSRGGTGGGGPDGDRRPGGGVPEGDAIPSAR